MYLNIFRVGKLSKEKTITNFMVDSHPQKFSPQNFIPIFQIQYILKTGNGPGDKATQEQ